MDIEAELMIEILEIKEELDKAIKEDKPSYIIEVYHKMLAIKNDELKLLQSLENL